MADDPASTGRLDRLVSLATVGSGRPLAALLLALWMALAWSSDGPIPRLRTLAFDVMQRVMPREPEGFPAKIVAIDETSLEAYGQWPWPRTLVAQLVEKIAAAAPAAIGFDVLFVEADRYSPAQLAQNLPQIDPGVATRLASFPSNDALLAQTFRQFGRVVLAKGGIAAGEAANEDLKRQPWPTVRQVGPDMTQRLPNFVQVLRSIDVLENSAAGLGAISRVPDSDGVVRNLPAAITVGEWVVPTLGIEMIRVLQGAAFTVLRSDESGYVGIDPGDFPTRIDPDGDFRIHHSRHRPERFVSARTVLESDEPIGVLNRRFVLIGATAVGLHDIITTPLERRMPGVEIHAQLLESLIDDSLLSRPTWTRHAELAATALGGLLVLLVVPVLRPGLSFLPLAVIWGALVTAAWGLFQEGRILFDPTQPAVGTGLVFVAMLAITLVLAEQRRRETQAELEREQRAAQILQGELNAARDIQMGILPNPRSGGLPEAIDLDARLVPARTVGGDLYDFFMIDERRLFFHIGDVTGKGVDAALFMALSKALCKSVVLRQSGAMDRILSQANEEIARENIADMMVTMFAGILDIETGVIEFCNAGHEAPFRLRAGAAPEEIESEGGPPLCALDEFDYPLERLTLGMGEMLILYTDGVTDARNPADELYGRERLADLVAGIDPTDGAEAALQHLYEKIDGFVDGADAADDITVLVLRRRPAA